MRKTLVLLSLISGLGQVIILFSAALSLKTWGATEMGEIATMEGLFVLMMAVLSFGLQGAVNRAAATEESWRSLYFTSQQARLTLSILLASTGVVIYFFTGKNFFLVSLLLPFIALNGDFLLYGLGRPLPAVIFSFLRSGLPIIGLAIVGLYFGGSAPIIYLITSILTLIFIGACSAKITGTRWFYQPSFHSLSIYKKHWQIGIYQALAPILAGGIFAFAEAGYNILILGMMYPFMKVFEMMKGGLKLVNLGIFRELQSEGTALWTDKVAIAISGFVGLLLFVMGEDILAWMGVTSPGVFALGIWCGLFFLVGFRASQDTAALFKHREDLIWKGYLSGVLVALGLLFMLLSVSAEGTWQLPFAIFCGELTVFLFLLRLWTTEGLLKRVGALFLIIMSFVFGVYLSLKIQEWVGIISYLIIVGSLLLIKRRT